MKKKPALLKYLTRPGSIRFITLIVLIALMIITLHGCRKKEDTNASTQIIRPVKALIVKNTKDNVFISLPAKTRASLRADLSFKVPGNLVTLPIEEGQEVKKGQVIAKIEDRDFKTSLKKAMAKATEANRQYERYKELFVRNQISRADFDSAKAMRDISNAQLKEAQNALKDTRLTAPFAGIIAKRYVENHQEIQAKQPIAFLQDLSEIEIIVNVPETIMATIEDKKGFNIIARFAVAPHNTFPLSLKEYSTQAEPDTQTYQVVLLMPRPQNMNILPGMTASVEYYSKSEHENESSVIIPAIAVTQDSKNQPYVWVINDPEMTVSKQNVQIGEITGNNSIFITHGLKGGEKIVTSGITSLKPGMKIRIWNN
jgi:RND family efflux transporter MFP subunit